MTPRDTAIALSVMAIWGFNFVVAKVMLQDFSPIFAMFVRFAVTAALMAPFAPLPRGKIRDVLILSVMLGSLHFPMMFTGLTQVDAATASVAIQLQVPFSSLLAAFLFGDRLGWRRMLGMLVAFAGVVLIAGEPRMSGNLLHLGLVVGASLMFAAASIHVKRMGEVDPWALNGWMGLFAAPQLLLASLLMESGQWQQVQTASWLGWGAILFMVLVVTMFAYGLWYPLLRRYPVNQTIPWTLLVPVFGVASGVLVLGDPLTPALLVGGALTLTGVAIIVLRRPKTVEPAVTSTT